MKRPAFLLVTLLAGIALNAQVNLDYYMPKDVSYKSDIPTPGQFTGHEVGEWHLTHDKLYYYMLELARVSDRAVWEEYGRSYENRPLGQLIVSSPENIRNLEQLRLQHLTLCDPAVSGKAETVSMPLFVKLGYGVHGNESSAQNASVLVAYYLVAGEGEKIDELLRNTVILIDPALNPDGMQRHSTWVNFTKSLNNNPDPYSWEFAEPWPGGRTNHYWFDLNRDYIMLQHPESVGRVAAFYRWRPNINNDHHEMDANSTFFFQPGVQSRNNPLTPPEINLLTAEIGRYHQKYLDRIGSLYYTEESYDDFYVGKGSSYPDIHGSVGILYEQAGVKGHLRETPGGLLSFPFAIRNQFTVSLSTLEAGLKMREKLLDSQRNFYKQSLAEADKYPVKAFVFSDTTDDRRIYEFIRNLRSHQIRVFRLAKDYTANNTEFKAGVSFIVPLKQNEYRFVRSLFETVTEFTDSVFYDISSWVLPMSFNIPYSQVSDGSSVKGLAGEEVFSSLLNEGRLAGSSNPYAWLFEWNGYLAPKALYMLQSRGITARVATDKFIIDDGTLKKEFSYGTIVIPAAGQQPDGDQLAAIMESVAKECGITIYGTSTGLTPKGIDLGSSKIAVLRKPAVLMFSGEGSNSSDAGEIWHLMDSRFGIPVTMVTPSRAGTIDFDRYNVIIVTGSPALSQTVTESLKAWNRKGGVLIGYESGNNWLARNKLAEIEFSPAVESKVKEGVYANRSGDSQVQLIPGTIFETKLDLTHPLCFGYTRDKLPVFKSGAGAAKKDPNAYNNPAVYTSNPLLSGYCTKENADRIKGSPFVSVHGSRVVSIYDNTNFRAIWYGTSKIFLNAVFFGQLLGGRGQAEFEE